MKKYVLPVLMIVLLAALLSTLCACGLFSQSNREDNDNQYSYESIFTSLDGETYAFCGFSSFTIDENNRIPTQVKIPTTHNGVPVTGICDLSDQPMRSIKIPESIIYIENGALSNCELVEIDSKNTFYHVSQNCVIETHSKTLISGSYNSVIPTDGSVRTIADNAFHSCNDLISIVIPDTITAIGKSAFSDCGNLLSITIGENVKSIGENAFDSKKLVEICNKSSLNLEIGNEEYPSVKRIITDESASNLSADSSGFHIYSEGEKEYLLSYTGKDKKPVIPLGITHIHAYAFSDSLIESVTLPDTLIEIEEYAFNDCDNLKKIVIPKSVKTIESYAFNGCGWLTTLTISEGVTKIGGSAFNDCNGLTSISMPNSIEKASGAFELNIYNLALNEYDNALYLGNDENPYVGLFKATDNYIEECKIHPQTKYINNAAFYDCYKLQSLTIPSTVKDIGLQAFQGCSKLYSINYDGTLSDWFSIQGLKNVGNRKILIKGSEVTGDIVIPEGPTSISDNMLYFFSDVTSITIPSTVKTIEENAFKSSDLSAVYFAKRSQLESIGEHAFAGCTKLTIIDLPNGLKSIGREAFNSCSALRTISIPNSITQIGFAPFVYCSNLHYNEYNNAKYLGNASNPYLMLVEAKSTNITQCQIHDNTRIIGFGAFFNCKDLRTITLPDNLAIIDNEAFYSSGLRSINFGKKLTRIGARAFTYNNNLNDLTLPDSLKTIEGAAFAECHGLTSVVIPENLETIGSNAFQYCANLVEVYNRSSLPITYESLDYGGVGYYAKDIYLSESVSKLSSLNSGYVIYTDDDYKSVIKYSGSNTSPSIPSGITAIDNEAFARTAVTSISLPDTVTEIGWEAFEECSQLKNLYIPDSIVSIGYGAFTKCDSLRYNEYNNGLYLGNSSNPYVVFVKAKNKSITECDIHPDTKIIYYSAFSGCSELSEVTIPDSVTSIYYSAFSGCKSLTSITIPDGITRIEASTFSGCSSLISISIPDSVDYIGNDAFNNCRSLSSIVIPQGIETIEKNTFYDCSSLTKVSIPSTVTVIVESAFYDCSSLNEIAYDGPIMNWLMIEKAQYWNSGTGSYRVRAEDQTLSKIND